MRQYEERFRIKARKRWLRMKLRRVPRLHIPKGIAGGILLLILVSVALQFKDSIFSLPQGQMVLDAQTILMRVRSMGDLTTSRYTFSSQVNTEIDIPEFMKLLYGQSQTLIVTGDVVAGVDVSKTLAYPSQFASPWNNRVTLVFPSAQIKDCILNESQTFVSADQRGLFATNRTDFDRRVRQFAVGQLLKAAQEIDIQGTAQLHADSVLRTLFANTDMNVDIQFASSSNEIPDSCQ